MTTKSRRIATDAMSWTRQRHLFNELLNAPESRKSHFISIRKIATCSLCLRSFQAAVVTHWRMQIYAHTQSPNAIDSRSILKCGARAHFAITSKWIYCFVFYSLATCEFGSNISSAIDRCTGLSNRSIRHIVSLFGRSAKNQTQRHANETKWCERKASEK